MQSPRRPTREKYPDQVFTSCPVKEACSAHGPVRLGPISAVPRGMQPAWTFLLDSFGPRYHKDPNIACPKLMSEISYIILSICQPTNNYSVPILSPRHCSRLEKDKQRKPTGSASGALSPVREVDGQMDIYSTAWIFTAPWRKGR